MTLLLAVGAAYLIGAIPVGYLVARVSGFGDIRRHGSGTIGATNVLRTLGPGPAIATLAGDIVKGALAVTVAARIGGDPVDAAAGAVAAVVGNCWPVFLTFKGGKGVATGFGAMLRLVPWATIPAAVVWIALAATFRYASLASLTGAVSVPLGVALMAAARTGLAYGVADVIASTAVAAIIVARHRENIARLCAGTERRLGERSAA